MDNTQGTPITPPLQEQQAPQQPTAKQSNHRMVLMLGVILLLIVAIGTGVYVLRTRNASIKQNSATNANLPATMPTSVPTISQQQTGTNPKVVAFMRKGDIFLKDFTTNQERKVSKASPVDTPQLSYDGKYISYFYLIHGGDGFPTSNIYIADTQGTYEANVGTGNLASRLTWAKDGDYVGFASHFTDGKPTTATLYDPALKKTILEQEVNAMRKDASGIPALTTDKSYNVTLPCATLEQKYMSFCKEYEAVLNKDVTYEDTSYKRDQYSKSSYTKPNYNLTKARKLPNGLVLLEYYTGEPQNPESKWGIGGGSFIPGYDLGVTDTYTVLLNETTGQVIQEIPMAIEADFIFQ